MHVCANKVDTTHIVHFEMIFDIIISRLHCHNITMKNYDRNKVRTSKINEKKSIQKGYNNVSSCKKPYGLIYDLRVACLLSRQGLAKIEPFRLQLYASISN